MDTSIPIGVIFHYACQFFTHWFQRQVVRDIQEYCSQYIGSGSCPIFYGVVQEIIDSYDYQPLNPYLYHGVCDFDFFNTPPFSLDDYYITQPDRLCKGNRDTGEYLSETTLGCESYNDPRHSCRSQQADTQLPD